jgi:quinoprotein glucose dehydrogenase
MRVLLISVLAALTSTAAAQDWPYYGGDAGGTRFSPLTQINRDNVEDLEVAWTYSTGEATRFEKLKPFFALHVTPILTPKEAGQSLVACSAFNRIIALDPKTGQERWVFDPKIQGMRPGTRANCRGVSLWHDTQAADQNATCVWRIFMGTNDRRLVSVDAKDGKPCADFGTDGIVDVNPIIAESSPPSRNDLVQFVSPPAVVRDTVILGSTNNGKFRNTKAPSGAVRAFDARTGKLKWIFDTVPRNPDDPQHKTWTPEGLALTGGANAWSMLSVDEARGLVFLPTASPAPDFFGGNRPGDNRYANSVVALKAETGDVAWHYQLIHHDVWDQDTPAQPILTELDHNGQKVPAVIQVTKQSFVFTFNRDTGEPIFPVEERPVPTDGVPGDQLSPTQPFPVKPPPLVPTSITPDDAWALWPPHEAACRKMIEEARYGDIFTPPSLKGTVNRPGSPGGSNWAGAAFDAEKQILVTTALQMPVFIRLVPLDQVDMEKAKSPMAGQVFGPPGPIGDTQYALEQRPLMSPMMTPCTAPPWAQLVAVDMKAGEIKWKAPLGVVDKLAPVPIPLKWGTSVSGGPIVTAGGLVFIGATQDERFRAFDIETGEEIWEHDMPTSAMATPMTYEIDGTQYVVIAAGGHMWNYPQKIDDKIVAFALPKTK